MKRYIQDNANAAAEKAAQVIADLLNEALSTRPMASVAFSGGSSPIHMFQYLVEQDIDWTRVEIFQVDERIALAGNAARNLTALQQHLLDHIDIPQQQIHAMPVENYRGRSQIYPVSTVNQLSKTNLTPTPTPMDDYAAKLIASAGDPPRLDVVHLGLGDDGHTASLPPGDDVLNSSRLVDVCGDYNGYRRMTLTYSVLNRARSIVWLITGADKKLMLERLLAGDTGIPAGRVIQEQAILVADEVAGAKL